MRTPFVLLRSPADGAVVVPCQGGELVVLDPDGGERWSYTHPAGTAWSAPPAIARDGSIVAVLGGVLVVRVNAAGVPVWSFLPGSGVAAVAIGPGGEAVFMTEFGDSPIDEPAGVLALAGGGDLLWAGAAPEGGFTDVAIGEDGTVHAVTDLGPRGARLLTIEGGLLSAETPLPGAPVTGPLLTAAGERIVRIEGRVIAYDAGGSEIAGAAIATWPTPPLLTDDGALFVTTPTSLERFDLGTAGLAGGWSRPRNDNGSSGSVDP